ncbi:hypothetical protein Y032_0179g701 [Ancylostoma ceylanicum]|nr:hypothetical protein Y032_0179g701 [Ancylostoma ceylanicum]
MDVFAGKSQGSQINYARGAINVGGAIEQQSRRCFLPTPVDGLWIEVPRKKNGRLSEPRLGSLSRCFSVTICALMAFCNRVHYAERDSSRLTTHQTSSGGNTASFYSFLFLLY